MFCENWADSDRELRRFGLDPALRFTPATRVENACASGAAAVYAARNAIRAGRVRTALVIGAEKITFGIGEREASFRSDRGSLTVRLIEGTFPNYRQLIPESYPNTVTVVKEELLDAIGRAALVAEDHIPVRLNLHDGGIGISVTRQEVVLMPLGSLEGIGERGAGDRSGLEVDRIEKQRNRFVVDGQRA